jgi:hypothetical protein
MPRADQQDEMPLPSESYIPWWSIRPCAAGDSLCRERDPVAIGLCYLLSLLLQLALRMLERLHVPRIYCRGLVDLDGWLTAGFLLCGPGSS